MSNDLKPTIEDAIHCIKIDMDEDANCTDCKLYNDEDYDCYKNVDKFVIEMLEKQVPKKPFQPFGTHSFKCPSCWLFVAHEVDDNVDLESEMAKYCPYCGQKLDWSE